MPTDVLAISAAMPRLQADVPDSRRKIQGSADNLRLTRPYCCAEGDNSEFMTE